MIARRTTLGMATCVLIMLSNLPLRLAPTALAMTEPYGLAAMSAFDRLPYINAQAISGESSSYDRADANDDGASGHGFLYQDSNGDQVLADIKGPGEITNIWFAGGWDTTNSILKFYFDGETTPRESISMHDLFAGTNAPFLAPLVVPYSGSGGGLTDYLPMPFRTSVKITVSAAGSGFFYNVDYRQYPAGTAITTWTGAEDSSAVRALWNNTGTDPKSTGGNTVVSGSTSVPSNGVTTLLDIGGPNAISSIKLTIPGVPGDATSTYAEDILNNLHIRIYWDGRSTPSVDAPIGPFFGVGLYGAQQTTRALAFGLDGNNTLYMYYPMPFAQHATIQIYSDRGLSTTGISYAVAYKPFTDSFTNVGYFTTAYRFTRTRVADPFDYVLLDATGSGKLVGIQTNGSGSVDPNSPNADQAIHWMEGDNHIYVDGSQTPQWNGTGTEDFYHGAGYFCCPNGNGPNVPQDNGFTFFSAPLDGFTAREFSPLNVNGSGNIAVYRTLQQDAVNFRNHIRVSFEHGGGIRETGQTLGPYYLNQNAEFWTLAYYYYKPTVMSYLTDTLNVGDPTSRSAHSYSNANQTWSGTHTYSYNGDLDAIASTASGLSNKGYSQFTLAVDPANQGVILRRTFDQSVLNMNANVYVNGQLVGPWYVAGGDPIANSTFNWRDNDLFIPSQFTQNQSQITVKIQFVSSQIDWDEFSYQAYSVVSGNSVTQPPIANGATFTLSAYCSHLALDVSGAATSSGSTLIQALANGGDSQSWRAIALPGGYYAFVNVNSGLVLDAPGGASTPAQITTWTGATSQMWQLKPAAHAGYVIVVNRASNTALDVVNASGQAGAGVQAYGENDGSSQQWLFEAHNPPATLPIQSGQVYTLGARVSNLNLDLSYAAAQPNQPVQQYTPNTTCSQQWRITAVGSEAYTLTSTCGNGTYVLDTLGKGTAAGTQLAVQAPDGSTRQRWRIELVKDGISDTYYRLTNIGTGLVMDVRNGSQQPGPVQIYTWSGSVSQLWHLTLVDTATQPLQTGRWYEISALASQGANVTLDVVNASIQAGAPVQQYTVNHTCSQEWRADYVADGYYKLTNQCGDKVLGVPNASGSPTQLQTWDWNGSDAELWFIQPAATSGYYNLINKSSGLWMDLANASSSPGTAVQQYTKNGGTAQQWSFHLEPSS